MLDKTNLIGAVLAHVINFIIILIFILRLVRRSQLEYGLGLILMILAVPLAYLLLTAPSLMRPPLYYIQIGFMLLYLIVELLLDYILKTDLRKIQWVVVYCEAARFADIE